jgi:peptidoglycan/xylan/chitin deacetylase (PgdA/CDA1 family)
MALSSHAPPPPTPAWPWPGLLRLTAGVHAAAGAALLWPGAAPWALGALLANHAVLSAAGLWPRSDWLGPNLTRLPDSAAARGQYALTIDDGPDPATTPAVLELLAAQGVRATFFCIGERARAHPALLREIVAAGHDVQNHSFSHRHHFSLCGPRALQRDLEAAQDLLASLTGRLPHCFRAPAGLRNPFLDPVLHRLNLHLVSWTRRGFDTRDSAPARVLARLSRGWTGGDILLLHDGNARRGPDGRAVLLDVLPSLFQHARTVGLQAVTLHDAVPPRRLNR